MTHPKYMRVQQYRVVSDNNFLVFQMFYLAAISHSQAIVVRMTGFKSYPSGRRSKNAATCGILRAGGWATLRTAQSRGYCDISRCPFSLERMCLTITFRSRKKPIRRLQPVLCQMRCTQLEGLPFGCSALLRIAAATNHQEAHRIGLIRTGRR